MRMSRWTRRLWGVTALTLGLGGCGGDGSSAPDASAAALSASTLTVAQYQAQRSGGAAGGTGSATAPDATQQAGLRAADQVLAVVQWQADFSAANPVVLPPLTYASARALAAAAQGSSLTQLISALAGHVDVASDAAAAAWQTGRVASAGWATKDFKLARSFLDAVDSRDGRLASWSLAEAGFADGSATADAALAQALASEGFRVWQFNYPDDIRLLLTHALRLAPAWSAGTSFDGLFESAPRKLWSVKLLRLTQGVRRTVGSDYSADVLAAGDLRVLSLRPAAGDLKSFATTRLGTALAEAVQALVVEGGGGAGELLLPLGTISLDAAVDAPLAQAGVAEVFDAVNANLRGLDDAGGTYAQTAASAALTVNPDGLMLAAAHAIAYTFSAKNVNGGSGAGGFINVDLCFLQPWPTPDLRSLFLAVLDSRGALLAIVGLQTPAGTAVPCE